MEVTFILIDFLLLNALPTIKRIIISVQNIKKKNKQSLMAILLVVLPNRTILDLSKPKTCPSITVEPPG